MFWPCGLDTVSTYKFDLDPCKVTNICMSDNHVSFCGVGDVERHVPVRKEIILKAQITDWCSILKQYTTFSALYAGIWRWWALPWELQLFAVSLRAEQLNVKLSVGMAMQRMGNNYFHVVFMSLKKQSNYLNPMKSHYRYYYQLKIHVDFFFSLNPLYQWSLPSNGLSVNISRNKDHAFTTIKHNEHVFRSKKV